MKRLTQPQKDRIVSRWVGTPYAFRECKPRRGVDCGHLIKGILAEIGIDITLPEYKRDFIYSDSGVFHRWLDENQHNYKSVRRTEVEFGDLMLLCTAGIVSHAGLIISYSSFIHITHDARGVCVEPISRYERFLYQFIRIMRSD